MSLHFSQKFQTFADVFGLLHFADMKSASYLSRKRQAVWYFVANLRGAILEIAEKLGHYSPSSNDEMEVKGHAEFDHVWNYT